MVYQGKIPQRSKWTNTQEDMETEVGGSHQVQVLLKVSTDPGLRMPGMTTTAPVERRQQITKCEGAQS